LDEEEEVEKYRKSSQSKRKARKKALDNLISLTIQGGKMLSEQKMSVKLLVIGAVLLIAAVKGKWLGCLCQN
jgi:hypothetical protein